MKLTHFLNIVLPSNLHRLCVSLIDTLWYVKMSNVTASYRLPFYFITFLEFSYVIYDFSSLKFCIFTNGSISDFFLTIFKFETLYFHHTFTNCVWKTKNSIGIKFQIITQHIDEKSLQYVHLSSINEERLIFRLKLIDGSY